MRRSTARSPSVRSITRAGSRSPTRSLPTGVSSYAFRDYLAHYNHGRGIVFIGHSQGATILIRLLQQEVDGNPMLRKQLVSALILGGNVTVPKGGTVGGDFAHIPACASSTETGCVVAYSSFASEPPANSQFGRTSSDGGVRLLAPRRLSPALRIMCVNPASPSGGVAPLAPYLPSFALGVLAPTSTRRCRRRGSRSRVRTPAAARRQGMRPGSRSLRRRDAVPGLTRVEQPELGLHVLDVNLALGNLVRLVRTEAAAYHRR